jgi:hypothetical protein
MKRLFLALAAFVIAFALFYFRDHPRLEPLVAPLQNITTAPSPLPSPQASVPPAVPPPAGAKPEFVEFLGKESVAMDSTNVDTESAERRAMDQAASMGPLEIQYSRDTVLSGKGSANQRVLALYMLTLAGSKAAPALREIVLAPLPDARVQAHSEEEHKLMQEKAQKVTAIDALAEQVKQDGNARDSLLRLADEVRDPGLRSYILKKIQGISR